MSSPTDAASIPDPLPDHLKALLELNRDAETNFWVRDWHIYAIFWMLVFFCGFVALNSNNTAAMLLFGMLILVAGLQRANERRAQRRLQLLLTVIRSLQRRDDPGHA